MILELDKTPPRPRVKIKLIVVVIILSLIERIVFDHGDTVPGSPVTVRELHEGDLSPETRSLINDAIMTLVGQTQTGTLTLTLGEVSQLENLLAKNLVEIEFVTGTARDGADQAMTEMDFDAAELETIDALGDLVDE